MKEDYKNHFIRKSDDLEIGLFNNSSEYLITHKSLGYRLIINKKTLELLNLIKGEMSLKNVVVEYNNLSPAHKLDYEAAYSLFYEKLAQYGIILTESITPRKKDVESYLSLSFTLVNEKILKIFTRILSPIFVFKYFYQILASSFAIVLIVIILKYESLTEYIKITNLINLDNWVLYFVTVGIFLFFHEFGHATACHKLGAKPGSIGFGFYLLHPVMFANVSDIWKLNKNERIYVNLAGLYVEILLALLMILLFFLTAEIYFLVVCSMVLLSFITNLNPFLRYDGYWILSDISNTPNLRSNSTKKLNNFLKYLIGKSSFNFNIKNIFLIIYAFISLVAIILFLGYIIFNDPNSLINFPVDLYMFAKKVILENEPVKLKNFTTFILPALFYFVLFRFIIGYITKKKKKNIIKNNNA